ncbi:MAG: reverse transcriptase domain-containing protein [Peptococcaceae bacterium]|nr:reverse transcriptase domain-containing protein [Peptococcaceae bacterium]
MSLEKEIRHAIRKIMAYDKNATGTPTVVQEEIIAKVTAAINNDTFHFENSTSLILNQDGKKRLVKQYDDTYSVEYILCQSIKQILDRTFKIRYPNRNKITHKLFNTIQATIQMSDFTIVKFDFKDYFNSVSSIYVFEKYLKHNLSDRREIDLIHSFVYSTKYAYAGFCTSNAIAEIIASFFDEAVRQAFFSNGLIYYERYIDDSILILNENMEETEVLEKLNSILSKIFYDETLNCLKCKTKFNNQKFKYISRRKILEQNCSIDFLGYEFFLSSTTNKIEIKYGITENKRQKYENRIDKLILASVEQTSPDVNNLELLRHRIAAFSSRTVYMTKYFRSNIWRVKGFIANYGELRYFLDTELIEENTEKFLKNMIADAFKRTLSKEPYFLRSNTESECGYNLYNNMKKNKTLLLVDRIGYDYKSLVHLCNQIGIQNTDLIGNRKGYGTLVREYLIKVRVGY